MKHLQTFITLALGMVFPCLATTYTSASYVQDGLITQWDGIDNASTRNVYGDRPHSRGTFRGPVPTLPTTYACIPRA